MARPAKPWFRKQTGWWMVEIGGKPVPLRDASLSGAEIGFAIDVNGMPYRFQGIVSGDRIDGRRKPSPGAVEQTRRVIDGLRTSTCKGVR